MISNMEEIWRSSKRAILVGMKVRIVDAPRDKEDIGIIVAVSKPGRSTNWILVYFPNMNSGHIAHTAGTINGRLSYCVSPLLPPVGEREKKYWFSSYQSIKEIIATRSEYSLFLKDKKFKETGGVRE